MRSAIVLSLLLLPSLAAAADLPVETRIDEVTVHPGSALVHRAGRVTVPQGAVRLILGSLTAGLQDDSLRFAARGNARARILGLSVEAEQHAEAASAEVRAAEEEVERLQLRDAALGDRLEAAAQQRSFLDGLRSTYVRERTENLAVRAVDVKEWSSLVQFVGARYGEVLEEVRVATAERRALAGELQAARERLERLRSKGARVTKRVVVDLQVERAGSLAVDLGYLVGGASWRPIWDARLDPAKTRVDLGLQARIEQRTGEDWSDVRLAVSTARPERSVHVPELQPRYLTRHRPRPPAAPQTMREKPSVSSRAAAESYAGAAQDDYEEEYDASYEPAQIQADLLSTRFAASARASVPSTGEPRKTFLTSFPLDARLNRIAVPALEKLAFLRAEASNTTGVTLLAGPLELYVGDSFVGRTSLAEVPAGGELRLAFGPDDRVRVDRVVLDRTRDESGLFSKRDVWRFHVRTTVENLWAEKREVEVIDHLPVSRDGDIEVKLLDGSTGGGEEVEGKPGVLRWKLALEPRQKKQIELRFEVSFPRGMPVEGLP